MLICQHLRIRDMTEDQLIERVLTESINQQYPVFEKSGKPLVSMLKLM